MKKIYRFNISEIDIFFDEKGELLQYWYCNDALYRDEYMSPLFKALGYQVEVGNCQDKRFKSQIIKLLKDSGLDRKTIKDEMSCA